MTPPQCQIRTDPPATDRQNSTSGSRAIAGRIRNAESPVASESTPEPELNEVIDLLGDDYVCDILRALEPGPKAARDLADQCGMSRPTVYRRLDRLTAAGLVEARMSLAQDGHHRHEFHLVFDELEVQIREDGIDGRVRVGAPAGD
jgi:DNA-binding HxlR family transcriptional regulator